MSRLKYILGKQIVVGNILKKKSYNILGYKIDRYVISQLTDYYDNGKIAYSKNNVNIVYTRNVIEEHPPQSE